MVRFFLASDRETARRLERCATRLETGRIAPDDPDAAVCFDYRPSFSPELRAALAQAQGAPAIMRTKIAHLAAFPSSARQTTDPKRSYGDLPFIVLTRGELCPPPGPTPPGFPVEARTEGAALEMAWVAAHERLARLSSRGERRTVEGAGHMIPFDKPDAIVAAVQDVLATARRAD